MVTASGLREKTPHAPIPVERVADGSVQVARSVGAIADYGNREGGQLDKANARGDAVIGIGDTCDRWAAQAKKKVEKRGLLKRVF